MGAAAVEVTAAITVVPESLTAALVIHPKLAASSRVKVVGSGEVRGAHAVPLRIVI